jgi:hypothetical protein
MNPAHKARIYKMDYHIELEPLFNEKGLHFKVLIMNQKLGSRNVKVGTTVLVDYLAIWRCGNMSSGI